MSTARTQPELTIAVINYNVCGFTQKCLRGLRGLRKSDNAEFLLIQKAPASEDAEITQEFPSVKILQLKNGDRADAKNLALREASGHFILFVTADTLAVPGAVQKLLAIARNQSSDTLISAQLLQENGMRRRTGYAFPSLIHEINPFTWLVRRYRRGWHSGKPPLIGAPASPEALHATFLMAKREVFEQIGEFTAGYRFAHEDIEYSARAAAAGIKRLICLEAHAVKMPPQLYGELPVEVRVEMERSLYALTKATRGGLYAAAFKLIRKTKSLCKWIFSAIINRITFRCSIFLDIEEQVHAQILLMPWRTPAPLPADIESHVRWEAAV